MLEGFIINKQNSKQNKINNIPLKLPGTKVTTWVKKQRENFERISQLLLKSTLKIIRKSGSLDTKPKEMMAHVMYRTVIVKVFLSLRILILFIHCCVNRYIIKLDIFFVKRYLKLFTLKNKTFFIILVGYYAAVLVWQGRRPNPSPGLNSQ